MSTWILKCILCKTEGPGSHIWYLLVGIADVSPALQPKRRLICGRGISQAEAPSTGDARSGAASSMHLPPFSMLLSYHS